MRLVSLIGATAVDHPEYGTAEAGPDGVFELADEFARALLKHVAHWRTEIDHLEQVAKQKLEELRDPKRAAEVLADLQGRIAELERRLAEYEPEPEPEPEKVPAAPAKKAAPKTVKPQN